MKNIAFLWETERQDSRSQILWFRYHEKMQNPKLDSLALQQYWRETEENKHCYKHGSI